MRYNIENYDKSIRILETARCYAYDMRRQLSDYKDKVQHYFNDIEVKALLDITSSEIIIKHKKQMMVDNTDIYYDICKILRYPNIKSYDDFNPEFIEGDDLPKNFDIDLLESYDRLLMRAMLEAFSENNRVSISLDISVTEKELEIKKKILNLGYKYYFNTLHSRGIPTILS